MNKKKHEIRQALLGNLEAEDDVLVVSDLWIAKYRFGIVDGFDNVFLLGVLHRTRWYRISGFMEKEQIYEHIGNALLQMGRQLFLKTDPEAMAVYCNSYFSKPVVIACHVMKSEISVSIYAGRGVSGLAAVLIAFAKFERFIPDEFERLDRKTSRRKDKAEKQKQKKLQKELKKKQIDEGRDEDGGT